ncbi:hypothetical protein B0J12DRAFT_758997 [Macrophomina phaseolina]|uniref:Uncharacterized protein n=1 Tax=Macrophomina phaseolina TaxID=35725 RepID=A0ABQ8GSR2_9PEZI|nr:hypothetical protein B0J12DRAFT_758997 [Macrophomina phaseolina]
MSSSPLSEPPDLTSDTTISTSPSAIPRTPASASKQTPTQSTTTTAISFDPNSSTDRLLARTAGMRIDTPTPYPRLLLEPHITIRLPPTTSPTLTDRISTTLQTRHGSTLLLRHGPDASPTRTANRLAQRAHRLAHPITRRPHSPDAFLASIAQPPAHTTTALPPSFLATASRALTQAQAAQLLGNNHLPPLFVYGHWMFPAQLAGALGDANALRRWTQRMVPAALEGWNRYCVRGRAPTAALLPHGCTRLRYYVREVVEQRRVEGRLVLGVSAEQHARMDALLEVREREQGMMGSEADEGGAVWGKKEVVVGVRVAGAEREMKLRALVYVWEADALDLHIFKQDKVWTPELYVDWYCRARRERASVDGTVSLE